MKVSLARYGKPSSTATLQASPLLGETDGAWAVTTYLEKAAAGSPDGRSRQGAGGRRSTAPGRKKEGERTGLSPMLPPCRPLYSLAPAHCAHFSFSGCPRPPSRTPSFAPGLPGRRAHPAPPILLPSPIPHAPLSPAPSILLPLYPLLPLSPCSLYPLLPLSPAPSLIVPLLPGPPPPSGRPAFSTAQRRFPLFPLDLRHKEGLFFPFFGTSARQISKYTPFPRRFPAFSTKLPSCAAPLFSKSFSFLSSFKNSNNFYNFFSYSH